MVVSVIYQACWSAFMTLARNSFLGGCDILCTSLLHATQLYH
jgi:hypothetical protein